MKCYRLKLTHLSIKTELSVGKVVLNYILRMHVGLSEDLCAKLHCYMWYASILSTWCTYMLPCLNC